MEHIIAIGIFQALVAAGLLWKSKLRNSADGILILLMVCIATHLSIKFIIYNFVDDKEVRLMMNTFIGFCYGPLLYLYSLKVINPSFVPASKWFTFIPFILGLAGYFSVISVLIASPDAGHKMLHWYNTFSFWALIPLGFGFSCVAIQKASNHISAQQKERGLIIQLGAIFIVLSALALIALFLQHIGYQLNFSTRTIAYSLLILVCLRIVKYRYVAFNFTASQEEFKSLILLPQTDHLPEGQLHQDDPVELRKNILSEEDMREIWRKLEDCMKLQIVFADCDLSLDKLASLSNLNKYHISETLNRYAGKSFYQYVNEYRTNHVLSKLNDLHSKDIHVNMLNLAFDAGFKSKSSFNRYFKELIGQTPSEYFRSLTKMEVQNV